MPRRTEAEALSPARKRELADDLYRRFGASIRQACTVMSLSISAFDYRSRAADQRPLVGRIKELTATRLRYDYKLLICTQY